MKDFLPCMNPYPEELKFTGIATSIGSAYGKAFLVERSERFVPCYDISDSQIDGEIRRFEQALMKARSDIYALKEELSQKIGEDESAIFDAHLLVLEDSAIINEVYSLLRSSKKNIDHCYAEVVNRFISAFEEISDPFIKERISDIKDVSKRVISNLLGRDDTPAMNLGEPVILISSDFSPSDFALIDKTKVLGIISEKGSQTSHTSILARSLRVPCVVGISAETLGVKSGDTILLDGYKGCVFINPSQKTQKEYTEIASIRREIEKIFDSSIPYPCETSDGHKFSLEINIASPADIDAYKHMASIDGVGLFRTEALFMDNNAFLSEDEQFEAYKEAVEKAAGKEVVIRTLDLGGDKNLALLKEHRREENPFMGYRAIRFCLDRVDLFTAQLKAILRASACGKAAVLFPMVSGINELTKCCDILEQAKLALKNEGKPFDENIKVGAMIEVPSAAMIIDILADKCDFISIGTNDLIQYLLAVDRVNDKVAHLYNPANPAVIRTLDKIVSDGKAAGLKVAVCGEIAADPIFAILLIAMGVDCLSMASGAVSEIKFLLRKVSFKELQALKEEVLRQKRSRDILAILRRFRSELMSKYIHI